MSLAYEMQHLMIMNHDGEDLKKINDKLIHFSRLGYEIGLKFQGQEEFEENK